MPGVNKSEISTVKMTGPVKTMMVIIPHEDDEINLAGATIYQARKAGIRVLCVFLTNGDWKYPAFIRFQEAAHSLYLLGVPEKDIIFLGYPDGGEHGEKSIFLHGRIQPVTGNTGYKETYGAGGYSDFSMEERGRHQPYLWSSVVEDMKQVILHYKPDVILATDFDSHPDHRMCYFAFSEAMKAILQEQSGYKPAVFTGFCYITGFNAKIDFYGRHLLSSAIDPRKMWNTAYETENPPYEWDQRICMPVAAACRSELRRNLIFKALCSHLSQQGCKRGVRVVNSDQVFWRRRTDNLIYEGTVTVSSGDGRYLYDFQMMNTHHIADEKPAMEDYLWIPEKEDTARWCRCDFQKPQHIEGIALYGNIDDENRILKGKLSFSTGYSCEVREFKEQGHENLISVPPQDDVTWVMFEILQTKGTEAGVSEWEILRTTTEPLQILQICVNGEFAYDWYIWPGENAKITAYAYGIEENLQWFMDGNPLPLEAVNSAVSKLRHPAVIRVESKKDRRIASQIRIASATISYRLKHWIRQKQDQLYVGWEREAEKRLRKQLPFIHTEQEYEAFLHKNFENIRK